MAPHQPALVLGTECTPCLRYIYLTIAWPVPDLTFACLPCRCSLFSKKEVHPVAEPQPRPDPPAHSFDYDGARGTAAGSSAPVQSPRHLGAHAHALPAPSVPSSSFSAGSARGGSSSSVGNDSARGGSCTSIGSDSTRGGSGRSCHSVAHSSGASTTSRKGPDFRGELGQLHVRMLCTRVCGSAAKEGKLRLICTHVVRTA